MKLAEIALVAERAITKPDIARVSLVFTEINVNIKVCSSECMNIILISILVCKLFPVILKTAITQLHHYASITVRTNGHS